MFSVAVAIGIKAQTSSENYIKTTTYQKAITSESEITQTSDTITNVTYYDALGRPKQQVAIGQSTNGNDIITPIEYDIYGRVEKEYLPFESTNNSGAYNSSALNDVLNFYNTDKYENTTNPYSQKQFEASPLNRVQKQAAPGGDWALGSGNEIELEFAANTELDAVVLFEVNFTNNDTEQPSLVNTDGEIYPAGELYKSITKDENHDGTTSKLHTTEEFTDKKGQVVLKRTYALVGTTETAHDTYYVYDINGNLTFVVPPKVTTASVSATELAELCYQYIYDFRNRLVEKKSPGKGWEYIVYNTLDQPVLTQDALLRENNQWLFTKYDALGRVAFTGLHEQSSTSTVSRATMQGYANDTESYTQWVEPTNTAQTIDGSSIYYTNSAIPQSVNEIYTINYYDDYRFTNNTLLPSTVFDVALSSQTKTLPTGSKIKVLRNNDWITNVQGYDDKGRLLYAFSENTYLNTTDEVENQLDFTGRVLKTRNTHIKDSNTPIVTQDVFSYDHAGRLLTHYQCIGDESLAVNCGEANNTASAEMIASNNYDALGQLESKKVGNSEVNPLQNVDYTYNIRGWLKQINNPNATLTDDVFAFKINYNETSINGATPLFNGNISETHWKTKNDNILRNYSYKYDALNRITDAISNEPLKYNVSGITYDKMGNIQTLNRKGAINLEETTFGDMDQLNYIYNNNKLLAVTDNGETEYGFKDGNTTSYDYSYDANGNLTTDANKSVTGITYNHLNLPVWVYFPSGGRYSNNMHYVYDALGNKLQKKMISGYTYVTTQYAGNFVYENGTLQFANHPEGYIEPINGVDASDGFDYIYQAKDHLGNIRVAYSGNNSTLIDSDFSIGTQSWSVTGAAQIANDNGKLKISADYKWNGAHKSVYNVPQDKDVKINFDLDMGTTNKVMVTLWQYALNGALLSKTYDYYYNSGSYTLNAHSNENAYRLRVKIEKSYQGIDDGLNTFFYVDNISLNIDDVTIREEKHYYPFGLTHQGYNNEVFGRQHPYGYNGVEEDNELGLGLLSMDLRKYDPTIGRFLGMDPVTHHSMGTSVAFDNNPIFWADPSGANAECLTCNGSEEKPGADGLTNTQWVELSRPGGGGFDAMRQQASANRMGAINNARNSSAITGRLEIEGFEGAGPVNCCGGTKLPSGGTMVMGVDGVDFIEDSNETTTNNQADAMMVLSSAGMLSSAIAMSLSSSSEFATFSKFVDGGAWRITSKTIPSLNHTTALQLRTFGRFAGGASLFFTYSSYKNGNIDGPTAVSDSFFTSTGLLGGPIGWGMSSVYSIWRMFGGKEIAERRAAALKNDIKKGMSTEEVKRKYSCFIKGTKILMSNLTEKNIEDIKVGDNILSVNMTTMTLESDLVYEIPNTMKKYRIIKAIFSNGVENEFSPAHPYWVKGKGWCVFDINEAKSELKFEVSKLKRGDIVLYYVNGNLKETKIVDLIDTGKSIEMYNIEYVKKNHTFFANSILVHNKRID